MNLVPRLSLLTLESNIITVEHEAVPDQLVLELLLELEEHSMTLSMYMQMVRHLLMEILLISAMKFDLLLNFVVSICFDSMNTMVMKLLEIYILKISIIYIWDIISRLALFLELLN
jgi:hypothetical protein